MNPARVREIQSALIREKYLVGQPTGLWDQRSKDAMQHYQSANGWQTKMVPDSRALIKLGLGPDRANLINPETAATSPFPGGGGSLPQR
ncbi:MAG: peptidoglycan-binding protein [Acidobacteriia bacterium]|nr:peptidoglycan-binding protein [Terriglobia bacterium]